MLYGYYIYSRLPLQDLYFAYPNVTILEKYAATSEKSAVGRVAHPDAGSLRLAGSQRCGQIHPDSHYHGYACTRFRRGALVRQARSGHCLPPYFGLYAATARFVRQLYRPPFSCLYGRAERNPAKDRCRRDSPCGCCRKFDC